MLYPLSYEGGGVFVQVTPYFSGQSVSRPSARCPFRARSVGEQRVLEPLFLATESAPRRTRGHDDHSRRTIAFEAAHRPQPRFESSVAAFATVVRVLLRVVKRGSREPLDRVGTSVKHALRRSELCGRAIPGAARPTT
jgi:hypothetical protein